MRESVVTGRRTPYARGSQRRTAGKMNATEAAYARTLDAREDVVWHRFEGVTVRLADDVRYTPDFVVQLADGTLECHEVKGYWLTAARVKIKVAADQYPFRFIAIKPVPKKLGGGWSVEEF